MRVYYMTSHKTAVEHILPERRLKLSLFHELNDPFELQPYSLADKDLRRINRTLEKEYFGKKGLMCFSDNWRSSVMWAHYAEKHYGVCLGFVSCAQDHTMPVGQMAKLVRRNQHPVQVFKARAAFQQFAMSSPNSSAHSSEACDGRAVGRVDDDAVAPALLRVVERGVRAHQEARRLLRRLAPLGDADAC